MLRVLFPNQVIRADDLGPAMVDVVVRGTAEREEVGRAIIHSITKDPTPLRHDECLGPGVIVNVSGRLYHRRDDTKGQHSGGWVNMLALDDPCPTLVCCGP